MPARPCWYRVRGVRPLNFDGWRNCTPVGHPAHALRRPNVVSGSDFAVLDVYQRFPRMLGLGFARGLLSRFIVGCARQRQSSRRWSRLEWWPRYGHRQTGCRQEGPFLNTDLNSVGAFVCSVAHQAVSHMVTSDALARESLTADWARTQTRAACDWTPRVVIACRDVDSD